MGKREDLLEKAQTNPAGIRFGESCRLAECYGFEKARQKGSHHINERSGYDRLLNFQSARGMAKPYQVR